jgi:hypothetical protein
VSVTESGARAYEEAEAQTAQAMERLVGTRGFGGLLGQLAENAAAITRLGSDGMDLVLRNLRVGGRSDIVRLSRQLARTEDKLERVLEEVEELRSEMTDRHASESSRSSRNARPASTARAKSSPSKQ